MKRFLSQFSNVYMKNFRYFYNYLGYRVFVALLLSLLVGVLDGLGLTMFLPLLEMVDSSSSGGEDQQLMGNLGFIVEWIKSTGLNITLVSVLIFIFVFFSLKGVAKFGESYYRVILQQKFIRSIRLRNMDLLSDFKFKAFISTDSGRIQNTFSGEVERVMSAYRAYFFTIQYAIMILVYVALAFAANPRFAILIIIGGGLTNFLFKKIYKTTKSLSRTLTKEMHQFQGLLIQNVANFKYLKASGLIHEYKYKLKNSIVEIEQHQREIGFLQSILQAIREPIVMLVVVIVILIQVQIFGESLGLIILSLLFFYRALTFLMGLQNYYNVFLGVSGSLENMEAFSRELAVDQEQYGTNEFSSFSTRVELKDLVFSYGGTRVLDNVNLTIKKNETIAIVGESGAGKTTLINILSGLIEVDRGMMFIDGIDINDIDIRTFQKRIGYVNQEPVIFEDSIYNNVTFWAEPTKENVAKFERALELASIREFVSSLPNGRESFLGNNGVTLSGGQRQRISIARELYKDVDFLFLDEATSALDAETEASIQQNVDALAGMYTIIVIAHRFATIKNADRIIYLSKNSDHQMGDFQTLKAKNLQFRKLVELQEFS